MKFLLIEPANNANAEGIIECIKTAFEWIGILDFQKRIMGLNVDDATISTGLHNGVGVLMQADWPWLQVIHCFNHLLDLAIKDVFKNGNFNKTWNVDEVLLFISKISKTSARITVYSRTLGKVSAKAF